MRIENMYRKNKPLGATGLFYACGSFGIINGGEDYTYTKEGNTEIYSYEQNGVRLRARFTHFENGVVLRQDTLENLSDTPVEINALACRFALDGNDYEVYTQYSAWQHESRGAWQPLVTQVCAESQGMRGCDGAAPMLALHNRHTSQNTVFHLLPNAQWKMAAKKFAYSLCEIVVVEAGFLSENLHLTAGAGEEIRLPEIFFFHANSKTDLDAYKLHEVFLSLYPRKKLPVQYNSWMYCFDRLDIDALKQQADAAAELGFEAFMIDAGWFGNGEDWSSVVGDWVENQTSGPCGRLAELSKHVRQNGMVFGLWFEPERASAQSRSVAEHPDYYINQKFLNFAIPEAVEYITDVLSAQIEKYHIGWVKFDFNGTLPLDPSASGYYRYLQGQRQFIKKLRTRFPDLYITNCASGGYRMELEQATMFDSFWLSDNQGSYEGIRIVKDTIKRMPSAFIERWNVQKYFEGFLQYGSLEPVGRMLTCNNGTWDSINYVDDSFTRGFISGGPFGFSCDVAALPESYREMWKEHIAAFKKDRAFYMQASARILADGDDIIAIEYSDTEFSRVMIQLFTKTVYTDNLTLYPVVDKTATYLLNDETLTGADIKENGIRFEKLEANHCTTADLTKIK